MAEIRRLNADEGDRYLDELAGVLTDCVEGGASVGFLATLTREEARTFFKRVVEGVRSGYRILLAAFDASGLVGTVQVVPATAPNQPHRADIAKLLVHRRARGQGVGRALMEAVEEVSRAAGKHLLVLDTVTGDAGERLYLRLGWTRAGVIPEYGLYPDGQWCDTTVMWKRLK